MGGNALNKVIASRINLEQYNKVKKDLEEKFNDYLQLEFVIDVPGKNDFGDIDMLYMFKNTINNENNKSFNIEELINNIYNPIEIVSNGPVCSFAYYLDGVNKYFQVDLILVEDLPMSRFYFSYGDLGGIIGRLTQHKSLKYGSKGLWVCPNQETLNKFLSTKKINLQIDMKIIEKSIIPNIILTNKPEKICEYLGLKWDDWVKGFKSKQEIFEWIKKSPWFDLDSFRALDYEHRNRINSRPMYQDFLKYIFINEPKFTIEKGNSLKYINKNFQLESLEQFEKTNILIEQILSIEKKLLRKEKFSGKNFLDYGIESKNIKKYLEDFKSYIETKFNVDFESWLDINNANNINIHILEFINK